MLWFLALLATLASAAYQRRTGPSYDVRGRAVVDAEVIAFRLPRSHGGDGDAEVRLHVPNTAVTGTLAFRRFRSHDEWSEVPMDRSGEHLVAHLPHQPPAGKVMYRVRLTGGRGASVELADAPVILRFRGSIPAFVLVSHVIVIFAGMLISTRAGLEALRKGPAIRTLTQWTLGCLVAGGLILGPIVQKYAFGAFWTGWPFGDDLTDNKLAVAVLFWIVALWRQRKQGGGRAWTLVASLVTLIVWLIPHSVLGSELDYTKVTQ
jgi:hypothetical protein